MQEVLTGKSKTYNKAIQNLKKLYQKNKNLLIVGESGTGKSTIINCLQSLSEQKHFKVFNSAQLIEKELEVHLNKILQIELQTNDTTIATVFEDIDRASFRNQSLLVKFIESDKFKSGNIQVILTSRFEADELTKNNKLLPALKSKFVNFESITIPTLKERSEDIPYLVQQFISDACNEIGVEEPIIDINTLDLLIKHTWVENIRQLKSVIETTIRSSHGGMFALPMILAEEKSKFSQVLGSVFGSKGANINYSLDTLEKKTIQDALQRFNFNYAKAAQFLGMDETTLIARSTELGLVLVKK